MCVLARRVRVLRSRGEVLRVNSMVAVSQLFRDGGAAKGALQGSVT